MGKLRKRVVVKVAAGKTKCIEWCVCTAHIKLVTTRGTLLTDVTRSLRGAQAQLKPGAPTGTVELVLYL